MDAVWTLGIYLAGVAFFLFVADESFPARLAIALLWPIPIAIFVLVILTLILAACVAWWPLAIILAAVGTLTAVTIGL